MRLLALLFMIVLASQPSLAESGKVVPVGEHTDIWGSTAVVSVVELGRDTYLAITIRNKGKEGDATAIVTKNEVKRVIDMCERGAKNKHKVKEGSFEVLDGLPGENEELHVVLVTLDGKTTLAVLQAKEDGRERGYILDRKSAKGLNALLKKAAKEL